jgi:hypothetical protein
MMKIPNHPIIERPMPPSIIERPMPHGDPFDLGDDFDDEEEE